MPERVALHQIVIGRKDERIVVKPGETFDFSDDDLKQLEAVDPPAVAMPPDVRPVPPSLGPAPGPLPAGVDSPRTARRAPGADDDEL